MRKIPVYLLLAFLAGASTAAAQPALQAALLARIQQSSPDTNRVSLLMKAGDYHLIKPDPEQIDLDSSFALYDQALTLSRQLHSDKRINLALKQEGQCYLLGYHLAQGEACFLEVIDYDRRLHDKSDEASVWLNLGDCILTLNDTFVKEKMRCYTTAKVMFHQLGDTLNETRTLKNIADVHANQNKFDLATEELLQVIANYKAIHYNRLYFTYELLQSIYHIEGDIQQEVFYAIETTKSLEADPEVNEDAHIPERMQYYGAAGATYLRAAMYDQCIFYSRKSWNLAQQTFLYADRIDIALLVVAGLLAKDSATTALAFMSDVIRRHSLRSLFFRERADYGMAICYNALKRYKEAEIYMLSALARIDSMNKSSVLEFRQEYLWYDYVAIGNAYIGLHQYAKASEYLKKIRLHPGDGVSVFGKISMERSMAKSDSTMGDYLSSMQHYEAYTRLSDSLNGASKTRAVQELQIKYETDGKNKNIQLLTQRNQLQEVQAQKSKIYRNMMIGGLAALLLLIAIVYNRYRLKQRNNLQLERQKQEILVQNRTQAKLLRENEWLLREVHHRVKNNLQVVMSLLNSQSAYLKDEEALNAVMDSQHRVQAMSLIHQKLYKSSNVSAIRMQEYIGDLIEYLRDSFSTGQGVYMDLRIEPVSLDVLQAIPLGLILNEIITNSFKYAFPCSAEDAITIRLSQSPDGATVLFVADNGKGLPPDYDPAQNNSFGMLLIYGLVEDLDGRIDIDTSHGTAYTIHFAV